ncbi:MAG TPA: dienelactone hydrolase family protein [Methylomirabilota bacterium]
MRTGLWFLAAALVAGCARGDAVPLPSTPGSDGVVDMRVVRPDGAGPFPAVVWLHGCAGLVRGARHAEDWTRRLRGLGYVVAIPDSFSARGFPNGVCGYGMRVPPRTRADDAYAALRHLEDRSDVVAERVGLIGHSHGGWTVLAAMDAEVAARARATAGARHAFAAAIAFYPECAAGAWVRGYRAIAPLLILAGELDDWTPAAPCQRLTDHALADGQPVSIVVYPRAYHSFDSYAPVMRVPEALQGRGATIGGDNAAREDSIKQVEAFLARHLR